VNESCQEKVLGGKGGGCEGIRASLGVAPKEVLFSCWHVASYCLGRDKVNIGILKCGKA
jgi:hypothetical protein